MSFRFKRKPKMLKGPVSLISVFFLFLIGFLYYQYYYLPVDVSEPFIITIDGGVATGKSSVAMGLARTLGFYFLPTGTLYRVIALCDTLASNKISLLLKGHQTHSSFDDIINKFDRRCRESAIVKRTDIFSISRNILEGVSVSTTHKGQRTYYMDFDITSFIDTDVIGTRASQLATFPGVRKAVSDFVKAYTLLLSNRSPIDGTLYKGMVLEGRDCANQLMPTAQLKIYLEVDLELRVSRRFNQLLKLDSTTNKEYVRRDLIERDLNDSTRNISPFSIPVGSIIINSLNYTVEETVTQMKILYRLYRDTVDEN